MSFVFRYLQYRWKELPIWLGIPTLGIFSTYAPITLERTALFYLAIIFSMCHVLLFNDWGDLIKNPHENNRYNYKGNITPFIQWLYWSSVIFGLLCLLCYMLLSRKMFYLAILGIAISLLYSHPRTHVKESLLGSSFLHLMGGEIQFLLGYMAFASLDIRGLLLGLFFSMIFTAGHFIHECIDIKEDLQGQIKTRATCFGVTPILMTGFKVFFFSHFYWLCLAIFDIISLLAFILFTLPLFIHLFYFYNIRSSEIIERGFILRYRWRYRTVYAICMVGFVLHSVY